MSDEAFIPPAPMMVERNAIKLAVDLIDSAKRVRDVNEAAAAQMADSIAKNGLLTPVTVRPQLLSDPTQDMRYTLVLGGHRLAAVKLLGWTEVACDVRLLDDWQAKSWEIDENLSRHELDPLDFGLFCDERQKLDEQIAQRGTRGGDKTSESSRAFRQVGEMLPRFTKELAERIGRGERTVQRAIATVRALDPETIAMIRGTPVASKEVNLVKLGREKNLNKRRSLAELMVSGEARTFEQAAVAAGFEEVAATEDPQKTYLGQLERAWDLANPTTRLAFLDLIDAAFIDGWRKHNPKDEAAPAETSSAPSRAGRRSAKGAH